VDAPSIVSSKPAKSGGCVRYGCWALGLATLGFVLIVGLLAAIYFKVPERIGLTKPATERLLSGEPDRQAAAMIMDDLQAAGMDTQGMWLYVIPIEGTGYQLAYMHLDASSGFNFVTGGDSDAITDTFIRLATSGAAQEYNIGRISLDYRDEAGEQLVGLTAPTQSIEQFANGSISRQEFMQDLEGKMDLGQLTGENLQ